MTTDNRTKMTLAHMQDARDELSLAQAAQTHDERMAHLERANVAMKLALASWDREQAVAS